MKYRASWFSALGVPGISGFVASLFLSLWLGAAALGFGVEKVPGITVEGGVKKVDADSAANRSDFKDVVNLESANSPVVLELWTRLRGNAQTLEYFKRPGVLPLEHEVVYYNILGPHVHILTIGCDDKGRLAHGSEGFLDLLTVKGSLNTSGVSYYTFDATKKYEIYLRTKDGKRLAGPDGKPFVFKSATPQ